MKNRKEGDQRVSWACDERSRRCRLNQRGNGRGRPDEQNETSRKRGADPGERG